MKQRAGDVARWVLASLPLAPAAAVLYLLSEWLFFVTKPSATSALPLREQLLVLAESPAPFLVPVLTAQAIATGLSAIAFPRFRAIAVVPAAAIAACTLLLLIDNFTYTLFRFGILTSGEPLRIAYAVLLSILAGLCGWQALSWLQKHWRRRPAPLAALTILGTVIAVPLVAQSSRKPSIAVVPAPVSRASGDTGTGSRPNILFLGVDGVDAALLSAYGYERNTSPFLERIREETLFFENAFSNVSRTHGALVALLTGRLPFSTRVTFPPTVLQREDTYRSLPALLKPLGYSTLQIGMRHYADAEDVNLFGFDAANYRWDDRIDRHERAPSSETDVFRGAVAERLDARLGRLLGLPPVADPFAHVEGQTIDPAWRDDRRVATLVRYFADAPEPWFVHLHMLDTHCCQYIPDRQRFSGDDAARDARDGTIREADDHIEELFDALSTTGRLERSIVVIYSDHGARWKATERVPLMIRFPRAAPSGRVAANVQLADVAPTVLEHLGLWKPEWMDGVSLLEPDRLSAGRPIFGVADVDSYGGPLGRRMLLNPGPPNYGARSAMLIAGSDWFELDLNDGTLGSGPVRGHTSPGAARLSPAQGRAVLQEYLGSAGFGAAGALRDSAER
jgi:arylsulfatase A-like enzyme